MQALGPFQIPVVGQPDEQQISGQGLATGVEIHNLSGWLLRIQIGSRIEWLPAFRVDRYPLKEGDGSAIIVSAILLELLGAPENMYLMTVAYTNDAPDYLTAFPGQYPHDVVRFLAPPTAPLQIAACSVNGPGTTPVVHDSFQEIHIWGWEIICTLGVAGGSAALQCLGLQDGVPGQAVLGELRCDAKGQISGYHNGARAGFNTLPFFSSQVDFEVFGACNAQAIISYSLGPND